MRESETAKTNVKWENIMENWKLCFHFISIVGGNPGGMSSVSDYLMVYERIRMGVRVKSQSDLIHNTPDFLDWMTRKNLHHWTQYTHRYRSYATIRYTLNSKKKKIQVTINENCFLIGKTYFAQIGRDKKNNEKENSKVFILTLSLSSLISVHVQCTLIY